MPTLFHIHDPMCSWCWGYRNTWDQLRLHLDSEIDVVNVLGGLAPDTDAPMPLAQQHTIASYWKDVAAATGAQFNFDFWRLCKPRRSTFPACRAVLAASNQNAEQPMIDAVQQAYYLRAMNPSNNDTLVVLAGELGLDVDLFAAELLSAETESKLQMELSLRRELGVNSFPSLVLKVDDALYPIPVDYREHRPALAAIDSFLGMARR
ncbi:DsbA family protein [Halioglobus maricola]|uniref:DsbA family protein n=2 Tax=Halioglobus maricola TaxID=2601894 RepID=A0A5P9NRW2_9GAMM|nr:DsbA family protein [Halioglobus maricola]